MAIKRVGLLSGTFDPVHDGHLALAAAAHQQLQLNEVWLLVNGRPPGKAAVSSFADRLAMVKLAAADTPWLIADREPVQRDERPHSLATAHALLRDYPETKFTLIMGRDVYQTVPHWHNHTELLELVGLAVAERGGHEPAANLQFAHASIDLAPVAVSAGVIRRAARENQPIAGTPAAVAVYIHEHRLYV